MNSDFRFGEHRRSFVVGVLLFAGALALGFLGQESLLGYNDEYYFLVLVIAFPAVLIGAGLLARIVFAMYSFPKKLY